MVKIIFSRMNYITTVLVFSGFSSHSRMFHSYRDVTIAGEGLQILTYARHSWTLSSEERFFSVSHLMWHRASVSNGHLLGPVTLAHIAEHLAVELSLPVFTTRLGSVAAGIRTTNLPLAVERSNSMRHRLGSSLWVTRN